MMIIIKEILGITEGILIVIVNVGALKKNSEEMMIVGEILVGEGGEMMMMGMMGLGSKGGTPEGEVEEEGEVEAEVEEAEGEEVEGIEEVEAEEEEEIIFLIKEYGKFFFDFLFEKFFFKIFFSKIRMIDLMKKLVIRG